MLIQRANLYRLEPTPEQALPAVGIDRGIEVFAATWSPDEQRLVEPLNAFKRIADDLAKAQQRLARKKKGSKNWKEQKAKIARIHHDAANARKDFLHKLSTDLSNSHGTVKMEKLRTKNMSASAKGTVEEPGKRVAQKSGLNRSILDQGWGMFERMVGYKQPVRGGAAEFVAAPHTSQTCPECGAIDPANRRTRSEFSCVACGHTEHADLVRA